MWASLISKSKQGGLDAIDTYVFWNLHEPKPGEVLLSFFLFHTQMHIQIHTLTHTNLHTFDVLYIYMLIFLYGNFSMILVEDEI